MNVLTVFFLAAGIMFLVLELITENRLFSGLMFACLGLEFLSIYFKNRENIKNYSNKSMLITGLIMAAVGLSEVIIILIK